MENQQPTPPPNRAPHRYELESDEIRRTNAIRIGRVFLDIEEEEIKAIDQESEKNESNNINQNNVSSPKNNSQLEKAADGVSEQNEITLPVTDILNDELISDCKQKVHSEHRKKSGARAPLMPFISLIRFSLLFIVATKELFEPCFVAVKTYLAGEPFREFETSMYFHR
jgi:hypothetical protein